jgi:hypothetical protein
MNWLAKRSEQKCMYWFSYCTTLDAIHVESSERHLPASSPGVEAVHPALKNGTLRLGCAAPIVG